MSKEFELDSSPRYLIPELVYDHNHPQVVLYTSVFRDRAEKQDIFSNISATINACRSREAAETMAWIWSQFTCHVPGFLARAVSLTDDPERQHHLIQIAYDELGGRNKDRIHSHLFSQAVIKIDIQLRPRSALFSIRPLLETLDALLVGARNGEAIIGLLLSFEIVAEENIEMLFECLSFDDAARETLSATPFFKIHRQDETEHIRHSVANFLRFCTTDEHRADFMSGFDQGIEFWSRLWDQSARFMNAATKPCAKAS
jgi:hypothetical protein